MTGFAGIWVPMVTPFRDGQLDLDAAQRLARNPQFVAIKESGGGNLEQLASLIHDTPLKVLSGEDHLIFVTCCLGGHGAISVAATSGPTCTCAWWSASPPATSPRRARSRTGCGL